MSMSKKKGLTRSDSSGSIASIGSVGKAAAQGMYLPSAQGTFMDQPDMIRNRGSWKIAPVDTDAFKRISQNVQPKEAVPADVCNKKFNRHLDVLPNPRTRVEVPMTQTEGVDDPTTAYYNGNYVHGPDKNDRAYICAMGPLPATLKTWWRMMWHNKVGVIIMATGLVEKKEKKCERYWAPKPGQKVKVADMIVKTTAVNEGPAYTTTYLEVQHSETNETRKMAHYWFTAWPDHGVPRLEDGTPDPTAILFMMRDARRWERQNNIRTPMMIHCSAGVGRSGTILAIDYACQLLEANKQVDIAAVVAEIRKDRVALVQHPQQYELCQAACVFYAKFLETPIKVDRDAINAPLFLSKTPEFAEYQYVDPSTLPKAPAKPATQEDEYKPFKAAAAPARQASKPAAAAAPAEGAYGPMAAVLAAKQRKESAQAADNNPYGPMAAVLAAQGLSPYGSSGPPGAYGAALTTPIGSTYGPAVTAKPAGHTYGSVEDDGAYGPIASNAARASVKRAPAAAQAELEYGDTGPVPRAGLMELYEDVDEHGNKRTQPAQDVYGNQDAIEKEANKLRQQQEVYGNQDAIERQKAQTASEEVVDSWAAPKRKPSKKEEKAAKDAEEKAKKEAEKAAKEAEKAAREADKASRDAAEKAAKEAEKAAKDAERAAKAKKADEDRKKQEEIDAVVRAEKEAAAKKAALEEQLRKVAREKEERARIVAQLLAQEEKHVVDTEAELKSLMLQSNDFKLAVTRAEMAFNAKEEAHRTLAQRAQEAEKNASEGPSLVKRSMMEKRNETLAKLVDVDLVKGNSQEKLLYQYLSKAPANKVVNSERLLGKKRYITDRVAASESKSSVCEDAQFFALLSIVVKKTK